MFNLRKKRQLLPLFDLEVLVEGLWLTMLGHIKRV